MYFSGQNGTLQVADADGNYADVGRIRNWSYNSQQQTLDTTCLKDTDKTIVNGVRSVTGQASLLYYEEATSNVSLIGSHLVKTGGQSYNSPNFGSNNKPTLCKIRLALDGGQTAKTRQSRCLLISPALL